MREYSATVGATDGNIIAAIITTQTPTNQPSVPRSVPGPSSIPRIRSTVDHHATAASARSRAMRPGRVRTAANAGASTAGAGRSCADAITTSGRPGEVRLREARPALVLDPEGVDVRALRLRRRELRGDRMEYADEPHRLARLDAEWDDVLDLEVDRIADLDAVAQAVVHDLDRRALGAEHLPDERDDRLHRAALLPAQDCRQLLHLLIGCALVDEHAEAPVALGHDLRRVGDRRHLEPAHVRPLDLAVRNVEDECDAAVVVCCAVVEGHVARAHELAGARLDVASL